MAIAISSKTSSHPRALTACLAAALCLPAATNIGATPSTPHGNSRYELPLRSPLRSNPPRDSIRPEHLSANPPHVVNTCADDNSAGSLRSVIASPNTASGDTIDLTQLPMMCSRITLATGAGAIPIHQGSLYLQGPGTDLLTIDANHLSSAFYHYGSGTLYISDLTVSGGYFVGTSATTGGCLYSAGSIFLLQTVVADCTVRSTSSSTNARGGGVYTSKNLTLVKSEISDGHAFSNNGARGDGGGVFAYGDLFLQDSTVRNNTAFGPGGPGGRGGGIHVSGNMTIERSTVSGNAADSFGGIDQFTGSPTYTGTIADSTISTNRANFGYGGAYTDATLALSNSTIAFNISSDAGHVAGLYVYGPATIRSTIIANNLRPDGSSDLAGSSGVTVDGSDNLIISSTLPPIAQTVSACPKLEPLQKTAGSTETHGLHHDSQAVDLGFAGGLTIDQRGLPRTAGVQADIGAVERQAVEADERIFLGGFDIVCDTSAW
jgi:hypothetical protein